MTEEEYFRKTYPDSCYGDKPLSPYWDFFQDGVEFGERQSEKKIEKLKADNDARKFAMTMSEKVEKQLRDQIEKMKCCNNCKFDNLEPPEIISNGVCENCINHSKWELED